MMIKGTSRPTELRYCSDIGLWAIDRPIVVSCRHQTEWCKAHCYNVKLYVAYSLDAKDARNEAYWQSLTGVQLRGELARKAQRSRIAEKQDIRRLRLMTRGEAFADHSDVDRVLDLAEANPETTLWIPTRAWRDAELRARLEAGVLPLANVAALASTDPTTTEAEQASLEAAGWSTLFFGDDRAETLTSRRYFLCPKTHRGFKGHCRTCRAGCFSPRQVHVHLKSH